eukprot:CAMPEP_0174253164 /NCGR_PEP_ID=MMETSP0439-20130205/2559_1 /TAXON_ID=0 /ORGANISM="Stereomyxa ramosa, Strain Chinc5" /LENGTH=311 /DNA_ID=CAMNT_0015334049 /DNA_START=95 /DNA_END=1030 /DNA_ORIENTATION=-
MGGCYYDREVSTTVVSGSSGQQTREYSEAAEKIKQRRTIHPDLDPKGKEISTDSASPVVLALDVTGSMGSWPLIIWDKLPMFYGQIMMNEYLEDPHICFSAVGDAGGDRAPVQVTDFVVGMEMDEAISKIFVESGGPGSMVACESYELSAYYFLKHCKLAEGSKPLFFFTADEDFYPFLFEEQALDVLGDVVKKQLDSVEIIRALGQKFNVFVLRKSYYGRNEKIIEHWEQALGPGRVLTLSNPKACVDTMLGIIAISGGTKDLEGYVSDMKERGQDDGRIKEVSGALETLNFELHEYTAEIQASIDELIS